MHGYTLAYTPEYDSDPRVETAPRKPPKDSFHPSDDEDFLYRLSLRAERKRLPQQNFFQQVNTTLPFNITYLKRVFTSRIFSPLEINWIPGSRSSIS
jgi:hypothetical protein